MHEVGSWANLMPWTVNIASRTSGDSYSGNLYGSDVGYRAAIQTNPGAEVIKDATNHEIVYKYKLYLATTTQPDPLDRVTLPSTFGSLTPEIVAMRPVSDESGIHHVVLWVK